MQIYWKQTSNQWAGQTIVLEAWDAAKKRAQVSLEVGRYTRKTEDLSKRLERQLL